MSDTLLPYTREFDPVKGHAVLTERELAALSFARGWNIRRRLLFAYSLGYSKTDDTNNVRVTHQAGEDKVEVFTTRQTGNHEALAAWHIFQLTDGDYRRVLARLPGQEGWTKQRKKEPVWVSSEYSYRTYVRPRQGSIRKVLAAGWGVCIERAVILAMLGSIQ